MVSGWWHDSLTWVLAPFVPPDKAGNKENQNKQGNGTHEANKPALGSDVHLPTGHSWEWENKEEQLRHKRWYAVLITHTYGICRSSNAIKWLWGKQKQNTGEMKSECISYKSNCNQNNYCDAHWLENMVFFLYQRNFNRYTKSNNEWCLTQRSVICSVHYNDVDSKSCRGINSSFYGLEDFYWMGWKQLTMLQNTDTPHESWMGGRMVKPMQVCNQPTTFSIKTWG